MLLLIFFPILISVLLFMIIMFFVKQSKYDYFSINEQSKKGTQSVLHYNSSYKVEDCMIDAKKVLFENKIDVDCKKFIQKY